MIRYSERAAVFVTLFCILGAMTLLSSCTDNPVKEAQTIDQKAFALYGSFVVYEETGVKLVKSPDVPEAAKNAVRQADMRAKPVADHLLESVQEYEKIEQQVAGGTTSADKLQIATSNLQAWVNEATPLVKGLVSAVKGVNP